LILLAGGALLKARRDGVALSVLASITIVSALLFAHYRYRAENPFSSGTGQSWSQFKLANWQSLFSFAFAAYGLASMAGAFRGPPRAGARATSALLAAAIFVGLLQAWSLADGRTLRLRQLTGFESEPLARMTTLSQQINDRIPKDAIVFLDFEDQDIKSRQLFALLLPLGRTVSDWSHDVFVNWMLPSAERRGRLEAADFRLTAQPISSDRSIIWAGRYALVHNETAPWRVAPIAPEYAQEATSDGGLSWVRNKIRFAASGSPSDQPFTLRIGFTCVTVPRGVKVSAVWEDEAGSETTEFDLTDAHLAFERPVPIEWRLARPAVARSGRLTLSTSSPAVRLGGADSREVTFFVRGLRVEKVL
jgi:hypothetical protein